MMKLLFLGQNPSSKAPNSAFVGTKSGQRLAEWIRLASLPEVDCNFYNCFRLVTRNASNLKLSSLTPEERQILYVKLASHDIVYMCGRVAQNVVSSYRDRFGDFPDTEFVALPHPSGLNRKLNDPEFVKKTIEKMKESYARKVKERLQKIDKGTGSPGVDDRAGSDKRRVQIRCPLVDSTRK